MISPRGKGGTGGDATVEGDHSSAEGGDGGDAVIGDGGRGGHATVKGDHVRAIGGRGGRGGIGPGGPGGDAHIVSDGLGGALIVGGDGGEAAQLDGRGGRGGRAYFPDDLRAILGFPERRPHMRAPYFEPHEPEPGSGGHSSDTPQYMARRILVEELKKSFLQGRGLPATEVWYDRVLVSTAWLNDQLKAAGHNWTVAIVDSEYEFADRDRSGTPRRLPRATRDK